MTATPPGRVRLFHTCLGPAQAPPLVLVHGWGGDGREWSLHAEQLADRFHVIVPDLRGHGRSPVPDAYNTPVEMAHDLAGLLRQLGTAPVVAVGHSMGGQVVNLLAGHYPQLVRAVVALDPAHGAHLDKTATIAERLARYQRAGAAAAAPVVAAAFSADAPAGLRTAHVRTVLGTPDHVLRQAFAGMFTDPGAVGMRPASEVYLRRRTCPALTVWASAEAADWERGTLSVPGSRVDYWADTGHYLHEERPDRTVRLLREWEGTAP